MANTVQSLDRAIEILEALANEGKSLGVTELSKKLGLHKSTVHRMLSTWVEWGYVEKSWDDDRYKLGLKVVELGSVYLNNIQLKTEALPYLRELMNKSHNTAHLARLEGGDVVYMDKVDVVNNIRIYSQIGKRLPAHCTALGKVMAAYANEREVEKIFSPEKFTALTDKTIIDKNEFLEELKKIKKEGWALDDEELQSGIRCVAAPVMDYRGEVIAAVSTTAPKEEFNNDKISEIKEYVKETARKISIRMGYHKVDCI